MLVAYVAVPIQGVLDAGGSLMPCAARAGGVDWTVTGEGVC